MSEPIPPRKKMTCGTLSKMQMLLNDLKSNPTLQQAGKDMQDIVLMSSMKQLLENKAAKKDALARPYTNSLIEQKAKESYDHGSSFLEHLKKQQADQDEMMKAATSSSMGDSGKIMEQIYTKITGIAIPKMPPPPTLSEEEKMERMRKQVHEWRSSGRSMDQIKTSCAYNPDHTRVLDLVLNEIARKTMYHETTSREAIKEQVKTHWRGQILLASDIKAKSKKAVKRTGYSWDDRWVCAEYKNWESGEKLVISGPVPHVQKHAVYDMDLFWNVAGKYGPQWESTRCTAVPPYHDFPLLVKFVNMCVTKELDPANKSGIRAMQTRVTKAMTSHHVRISTPKEWAEWLLECEWSRQVQACCKLDMGFAEEGTGFSARLFPLTERAYQGQSSMNAKFRSNLSDSTKALIEKQFHTPELAIRMCFRETMPAELKFLCQVPFDPLEDAPLLREAEAEAAKRDEKKKKKRKATGTSADEEPKNARSPFCDTVLEANHFDHLWNQEALPREPSAGCNYLPEVNLIGFNAICKHQNWIEKFQAEDASREMKAGRVYAAPKLVPELQHYLDAITVYHTIRERLDDEDSEECAIMKHTLPLEHQKGVDMLVQMKVLESFRFECAKVCHDAYKDQCKGDTHHDFLFHAYWARFKRGLVKRIEHYKNYPCPSNTLDKIPEALWAKFNKEQRAIVDSIVKNAITIVRGKPGTGKTAIFELVEQAFPGLVMNGFTGRSVEEAASRMKIAETATIHSWKLRESIKSRLVSVYVVDEASMTTELLLGQTLAVTETARLVIMGDEDQYPAFGRCHGSCLRELKHIFPTITMVEIFRQKANPKNKIVPNCQKIVDGKWPLEFDANSFRFRPAEIGLTQRLVEKATTRFEKYFLISGTNATVQQVNLRAIKILHKDLYPPHFEEDPEFIRPPNFTLNTFAIGDRVIFTKGIRRNQQDDEMDAFLNRKYYEGSDQWPIATRNLYRNRQVEKITSIIRVTDFRKLTAYYRQHCVPLDTMIDVDDGAKRHKSDIVEEEEYVVEPEAAESEEDFDPFKAAKEVEEVEYDEDELKCPAARRGGMIRYIAKPKLHSDVGELVPISAEESRRYDEEESGLTSDARSLPFPDDCVEELPFYTRAKHQGPEFVPSERVKDSWGTMSTKDQDREKFFQDLNVLMIGASGRIFRASDAFSHGIAITGYSSQGAEADEVDFYDPDYSKNPWMQKKFGRKALNTIVSRSKVQFTYLGENPANLKKMIDNCIEPICCLAQFFNMK